MATGQARELALKIGAPVAIGDGSPHYTRELSEILPGNPYVLSEVGARKTKPAAWIRNYPGHRPYILTTARGHIEYNPKHRAIPGNLYPEALRPVDLPDGDRPVILEPHVKGRCSRRNKDWGWQRWEHLSALLKGMRRVQLGPKGARNLLGCERCWTPSFLHACWVLQHAALVVTTDGGLHHAAAALGVPAVVIWGGYSSPRHLGYEGHLNLVAPGEPCGTLGRDCEHCRKAMATIDPEQVAAAVYSALEFSTP